MKILFIASFLPMALLALACGTVTEPEIKTVQESYIHIRPAWSPDGSTIAFTSNASASQGIYTIDTSGSGMSLVVAGEGIGVSWSPDSRWISYSAFRRIYRIKPSGDSLSLMAQTTNDIRPAWSPDGSTIVYVNNGLKTVTISSGVVSTLLGYGDYPSWNGNDEILFLATVTVGSYQIQSYRLSTQQAQIIHSFSPNLEVRLTSVHPAGTSILFSAQRFDRTAYAQIYVMSLSDFAVVQMTTEGADHPAWSPDGSKIVYMRPVPGEGGLWIMNTDGSGRRRLTAP